MKNWIKWWIGIFLVTLILVTTIWGLATPSKEKTRDFWLPENYEILNEGKEIVIEKFQIKSTSTVKEDKIVKEGKEISLITSKEKVKISFDTFKKIVKNSSLKISVVLVKKSTCLKIYYFTQVLNKWYLSEHTVIKTGHSYGIKKARSLLLEDKGKGQVLIQLERGKGELGKAGILGIIIFWSALITSVPVIFITENKLNGALISLIVLYLVSLGFVTILVY